MTIFSYYVGDFSPFHPFSPFLYCFYPFKLAKHDFSNLMITFMHSTLQILSNDMSHMHFQESWQMLTMEGGGIFDPPKKGGQVKTEFRLRSIIVYWHIKIICAKCHACIVILQLLPSMGTRTSQVLAKTNKVSFIISSEVSHFF